MTPTVTPFQNSWHCFLQEAEIARQYKVAMHLTSLGGVTQNPYLERLLPSLLFVRIGSLLDEAMEDYISSSPLVQPKQYRNDLNGRICFLESLGLLLDAGKLHKLREKRNDLAHETSQTCDWVELEDEMGRPTGSCSI